jgi:ribosomal protein L24E
MPPPTCTLCDTEVNPGEGKLCAMHEKSTGNGDPNGPPTSG